MRLHRLTVPGFNPSIAKKQFLQIVSMEMPTTGARAARDFVRVHISDWKAKCQPCFQGCPSLTRFSPFVYIPRKSGELFTDCGWHSVNIRQTVKLRILFHKAKTRIKKKQKKDTTDAA